MAYMTQENKKKIAANLRKALQGSGLRYSLSVHNHSTIKMKVRSGPVDFIQNFNDVVQTKPQYTRAFDADMTYMRVNDFHYQEQFSGRALDLLSIIIPILNEGNHNRSDIRSDYFDVGWYVDVSIGEFGKPYRVEGV
jgi:hypothetical protein